MPRFVFQLDKLNTSDTRRGEWIAGHIKECEAREKRIKDFEDVVTTTPTCQAMQQAHEKRLVGVGGLSLPKIRHSMKNRGYVCLHYDHMAHKRN
jgi:hypothetical protein